MSDISALGLGKRERPGVASLRARVAIAALVAIVATGCTNSGRLAVLHDEPILQQPPGAVELAREETAGRTVGFGTPARVQIVWGIEDPTAVADWYLAEIGDAYGLHENAEGQWLGRRPVGDIGINVSVQVWASTADVNWESQLGGPDDVQDWPGPVAITRASSP